MENTATDTAAFPDAIQDETIEEAPASDTLQADIYDELVESELTEEDKASRRVELESIDREIIRLEEQKKSDNKVVNGEIKVQKARKDAILQALDSGTEKRMQPCYERLCRDGAGNIIRVEIRRVDTDDVVEERAATQAELDDDAAQRQGNLFYGGGSEAPPADPVTPEDFEPTTEALAQAAEDEGRVVKTNAKAVKAKRASKKNGVQENPAE
jgi:hypothetical protein